MTRSDYIGALCLCLVFFVFFLHFLPPLAGRQGVGGGLLEQQRPRSLKSLKQPASLLQFETNLRIPDVNDDAMVMRLC